MALKADLGTVYSGDSQIPSKSLRHSIELPEGTRMCRMVSSHIGLPKAPASEVSFQIISKQSVSEIRGEWVGFKHNRSHLTYLADETDVKNGKVLSYIPTKVKSKMTVEPRVLTATLSSFQHTVLLPSTTG